MVLSPAQVIPFLTHDDPLVRRQARFYFSECGDPTPATADDVWAAIDRHPKGDGWGNPASILPEVPQTDASVHRLLAAIGASKDSEGGRWYQRAVRAVEWPLLVRHRDLLLGCDGLDDKVHKHLERRLQLADLSADAAWDQLMALGVAAGEKYYNEIDVDEADALIEAGARHIESVGPRAVALLADESVQDYREIFAVQLVGRGRHMPAAAPLLVKLSSDADLLPEEASKALGRLGTAEVVELVFASALVTPNDVLFHGDTLGRIKSPASEAALVRLIDHVERKDDDVKSFVHNDLLDLCSLAGLDAARQLIESDPRHPESIGLCQRLLATAVMHGVPLPEDKEWRKRVAEAGVERAARAARFDKWFSAGISAQTRKASKGSRDRPDDSPPSSQPGDYDPYDRIAPIRNAEPKVGRNDPCPCGSGKKHKKCCGAPK